MLLLGWQISQYNGVRDVCILLRELSKDRMSHTVKRALVPHIKRDDAVVKN